MIRFRDFTNDLLDLSGQIAWRAVKSGAPAPAVR